MFLNPLLLLGISAISVPIIIHLLNRRKHQLVVWAAMRFVLAALKKNQRRMNIEDLILLALRCLLLAMLALAMARPALQGTAGWFGQSPVTAVIVIDNSYSMSQTDGTMSRFDQAKKKVADQIINAFPSGSSTAFLLASDVVQEVIPEPTYDLNFAKERIYQAQISDHGTNLLPALQKAVKILENRPSIRKEVYLITDGQAGGWRQMGGIQKLLEEKKDVVRTHLVFVGEQESRNLGVSVLRLAGALAPVNRSLRFDVEVTNYGREEVRDVPVRLVLDNDPPSEETTIDKIGAGQSKSISLFAKIRNEGFHTVAARIGHDQLPRDDQRSLVVHVIKQIQVLLVEGKPGREPREGEAFFLKRALQPVDDATKDQYYIQPRTITPAELETTRLDEADVIVLANVSDFSSNVLRGMERAVREGRGLIIFPGDQANLAFYNEQMGKQLGMLPAVIGEPQGDATQTDKFWTFQNRDFTHPITALWNDPAAGNIASVRFYRRFDLTPAPAAKPRDTKDNVVDIGPVSTVLNYNDGKPAVLERSYGLGKVLLFSSPASSFSGWNDLAVRPRVFLPLVHRILGAMLSQQESFLNIRVGQKFIWRVGGDLLGRDVMISRPDEDEKARDSRKIEMVGGYPTVSYDRTDLAGIYLVNVAGDAAEPVKFAAQADPQESRLEAITPEQRETLGNLASVTLWSIGVPLQEDLSKERVGKELWLYFAVAAVALAAAETYLAHRFSQTK